MKEYLLICFCCVHSEAFKLSFYFGGFRTALDGSVGLKGALSRDGPVFEMVLHHVHRF